MTSEQVPSKDRGSYSKKGIFKALEEFLQKSTLDEEQTMKKGIFNIPPAKMDKGGVVLFENIKKGGFATLVVSGRARWNPRSRYFEAARNAARRGKKITRLFLLMNSQYLREETVREHWLLDIEAGIKVEFAYIDNWILENPLPIGTLDFGIWDNEIACFVYTDPYAGEGYPREWIISKRQQDIELAIRTRDSLLAHRAKDNPDTIRQRLTLEEPMLKSAPLMKMLSEVLCKGSYVDKEGCGWYHGVWQYLRILDMVSTPTWHSEFYKRALAPEHLRSTIQSPPRILVSGTADYSMTAHIIWAHERRNTKCPHITVLDLCQTPLWLNKWYAARNNVEIDIVCSDIFEYSPEIRFDYVVTDAFLTRFNEDEKRRVVNKWHSLLSAKGKVVTTARIDDTPSPVKATPYQVSAFGEKVEELAKRWQEFISMPPEEISSMATIYAENMISYPFEGLKQCKNLFLRCGFDMPYIEEVLLKGEMKPTRYVEVIAVKKYKKESIFQ